MTHKHEVAPLGCHLWVPRCWICCIVLRAIAPVSGSQVSLHPSGSISEHSRYIYQNAQIFTLSIVLIFIWLNSNLHKNRGFTRLINYPLTRNSLDYRLTQLINLTSKHPQQHTTNTIITYLIQISHNLQSSKINSGWKFRDVTTGVPPAATTHHRRPLHSSSSICKTHSSLGLSLTCSCSHPSLTRRRSKVWLEHRGGVLHKLKEKNENRRKQLKGERGEGFTAGK